MDILIIFQTMVKLLLLLILGYALNKLHILDETTNRKLSDLIVNVSTPMLIISSVSSADGGNRMAILGVLGGALLLYIGLVWFGELAARLPIFDNKDRSENACMMVFSNSGFMGIPVMQSIYGLEAVFYNSIINFPYNIFIYSYAVLRLSSGQNSEDGKRKLNFRAMLTPGLIMAMAALIIFLTGIRLPSMILDVCDMVGSMTSPLSMLVLGSTIALYPLKESLTDGKCYLFSCFRLIIIPLIALGFCRMLGIDDFYTGIVTLSCAMPVGSMVLMMANRFGGNTERISRTILVTTLLSVITIPLIATILTLTQ